MTELIDNTPFFKKKRYLVVLMAFLGYINLYTLRVNMSVAIVAMTDNKSIIHDDNSETFEPEFDWSSKAKGYVLSSFFYGYICTQIPGGILASKIGGQWVFGLGILGTAVMTLLTPILCYQGIGYLILSRVIQGICSGLAYPSINMVYANYIPPIERSRTASYGTSGIFVGTILGNFLSGLISEYFGWEYIFYIFGAVAVLWYVLWYFTVKSGPDHDSWMSQGERDFIKKSIASQSGNKAQTTKTPWKAIFTSIPVYAIAISHFSYNWGYYTMLTQLPMYMRDILDFDVTKSGFLSALPYLVQTIIVYISGFLADFVQKKNILTTTQVRKYFNTTSFVSQTIFLLIAAFVSNTPTIVACISMTVGIGALAMSGWLANTLDIAPQFGSIILGISNTLATLPGIVSPILSGYIASTPNSFEYRIIFIITCAIGVAGMTFYLFFASAELQPWAVVESNGDIEKNKNTDKKAKNKFKE
ncbi:hypothetical protein PVAND_005753 [Polypedilum vanderplanki]|uniref:Sialin n=1 Tax=Polypedilum vanderplanki TaxID=319348 RepID=A0A9J6C1X9_POLVA|nr:hypothetical protein PVAND_005753 [Polypedilum vanderplanki]